MMKEAQSFLYRGIPVAVWRDHQAHLGKINLMNKIYSNKVTNVDILSSLAKDLVDKEIDRNVYIDRD